MKKIYINPTTTIVKLEIGNLLDNTSIAVGAAYQKDDVVLSREGGSFWDDDDEEY